MSGVNRAIIVGRVGQDPEMKYMPNGKAVTNLSVATSEEWKDKNTGQKESRTEWHRVVAFDKLAEIMGQYLNKGSLVYIEGKLQTRSWEQDGVKRYSTEIVARDLQMLSGKNEGGQQQSQQHQEQAQGNTSAADAAHSQERPPADNFDDDIPFTPFRKGQEFIV